MNKKLFFSVLLAVCLLTVVTVVVFAQSSTNVRWEYSSIRSANVERANELGRNGWELVAVNSGYDEWIFKRRLP